MTITISQLRTVTDDEATTVKSKFTDIVVDTHATTWSGIWGSSQSGDIKYSIIGKLITLEIPSVLATQSASGIISIDTVLPPALRPSSGEVSISHLVQDNATEIFGYFGVLNVNGNIQISNGLPGATFSGSGAGGWSSKAVIQYFIA